MIRYLDTSVLVAALTVEARTDAMQVWISKQPVDDLAISDWVIAEFSAALSMKLRNRQIDSKFRAGALASFARMSNDNFEILPVSSSHFSNGRAIRRKLFAWLARSRRAAFGRHFRIWRDALHARQTTG